MIGTNKSQSNTVIHIYPWVSDSSNPYRQLNYEAWTELGHKVYKIKYKRLFPLSSALIRCKGENSILILDWVHTFYSASNFFNNSIKIPMALLDLTVSYLFPNILIVWNLHNYHRHDGKFQQQEKIFFRLLSKRVNFIRFFSSESRNKGVSFFGKKAEHKFIVALHGLYDYKEITKTNRTIREEFGISKESKILFIFGTLRRNKGIVSFSKMFSSINHESYVLIIAGKPEDRKLQVELEQCAEENNNIYLDLQFIEEKRLINYMSQIDYTVLPYVEITNSGALFLSLTYGKKVIARDLNFFREVICNEEGYLYSSKDELASLFEFICTDIESSGIQVRNYSHLTWKSINSRLLSTIEGLD